MSDLPTGLHAWNARCQAWNLMSGLSTGLTSWNARCQAWTLMSDLHSGLHPWNARCQAWNLMSDFCLLVLEFYGPVNNEVMSSRSSGTVPGQA